MDRNRGLDINALRQQLEDLFEDFFPASGGARRNNGARGGEQTQSLPLNLAESDEAFTLSAPLPGFQPEDVDITVRGQNVTVRAQHKTPPAEHENLTRREWGQGAFQRSFELPAPVDADQATAAFRHGVVTVTLPKGAPSSVTVEGGGQEAETEAPAEVETVAEAAPRAAEEPENAEKDKSSFYMAPSRGRRGRRHAGPKTAEPSEEAAPSEPAPGEAGTSAPEPSAEAAPPEGPLAEDLSAGAAEAVSQEPQADVATSVEEAQAVDRDEQAGPASDEEAGNLPSDEATLADIEEFASESRVAAQPPTD